MPVTIDLSNKTALITGAAGELGRAITRGLTAAGASVAIHYNNSEKKAAELCAEVQAAGGTALTVKADVTNADSVFAMRDTVTAKLGAPHIIVNNAVTQYQWTSVLEQAPEDYENQFRSSVLQSVLMAKAFVPAMIKRGWGRVIAINTECSMQCRPSQSAYVSGKRGMDGVLRVLAREVGPHGITVNQVAPGWMISDRDRDSGTQNQPDYQSTVPLGHRGEDREIANAVVFLASDLAGFISGVYLPVCGGNVMPGI